MPGTEDGMSWKAKLKIYGLPTSFIIVIFQQSKTWMTQPSAPQKCFF